METVTISKEEYIALLARSSDWLIQELHKEHSDVFLQRLKDELDANKAKYLSLIS